MIAIIFFLHRCPADIMHPPLQQSNTAGVRGARLGLRGLTLQWTFVHVIKLWT